MAHFSVCISESKTLFVRIGMRRPMQDCKQFVYGRHTLRSASYYLHYKLNLHCKRYSESSDIATPHHPHDFIATPHHNIRLCVPFHLKPTDGLIILMLREKRRQHTLVFTPINQTLLILKLYVHFSKFSFILNKKCFFSTEPFLRRQLQIVHKFMIFTQFDKFFSERNPAPETTFLASKRL